MLFAQAHKEAKAGMKAHMAKQRRLHNAQLRRALTQEQVLIAHREIAATVTK